MSAKYPAWVQPFLDHLKASSNMAASARAAGISYSAMTALRAKDADFSAAVDEALEEAYDHLEAEARRRAFEGVHKPVVYQGQLTPVWERDEHGEVVRDRVKRVDEKGDVIEVDIARQARDADGNPQFLTTKEYSDSLAMFLLKGYRRRKFGDKQEITGLDGAPLAVVDETKKAARLAALVELAKARRDSQDLL